MNTLYHFIKILLILICALGFTIFYPMLISIYVFLPLLIGVMGYMFMRGIEDNKFSYIFISLIYFTSLEVNLSLPFFLMIIASMLVYLLFYRHLDNFRKCSMCRPLLSVILIDFVYLGLLLSYDFYFPNTQCCLR